MAPVVQTLYNAIHRINHYPVDSVVCFVNTYPVDSDLSGGSVTQPLNNRAQQIILRAVRMLNTSLAKEREHLNGFE